ncbi:MAG: glycosyltransferase family 2 protein [Candidatus Tectomicrobia bacterium]|uniref:Glycosyltransferase family 2 protein n=1 Tax=Tectimicrobiota bacterium TaxID=2528274 RepID=A0A932M092_UNCTE|nr:glycosyltransferase family 2 protein [Candidatus Tectomicrobia bacterium]
MSPESSPTLDLTVVIPVFNEAPNLRPLCENLTSALSPLGRTFEILLIDDGSSDESLQIYPELCRKYEQVKVIRLRRNFGQTAAFSAGFDYARGRIIVAMDGDLQNDAADIPALLKKIEEGYDLVSGWRVNRRDKKVTRILPSRIANWLISRLTGVPLHDYGCSLKAYRAEVAKNLALYGELHRFIPVLASMYGATIAEIPVQHHPRRLGKSKYTLSRVFRVVIDLGTILFLKWFLDRPQYVFGRWGLILFSAGLVIDGYLAALKIFWGEDIGTRPLLILGVLLILAGMQIFFTGILAEIQIRTYYESQKKPRYHVREVLSFNETIR